jgi:hypothetical protein
MIREDAEKILKLPKEEATAKIMGLATRPRNKRNYPARKIPPTPPTIIPQLPLE